MKRMLLLSLILAGAGPLDEIDAARAAYSALPPDRQHTTLFVSLLGVPAKDKADVECAFDLALNQTTFRRKPVHLQAVASKSQTLYAVDTEDLQWNDAAIKRLLSREPYFYTIDPTVPLIRADWFVSEASFGETYYDLLQFGKTLNELDKRVGLDRKTAENLRALHGARVVESGVALNPRAVARFGSTLGAYWQSFDVNTDNAAKNANPFENIDELIFKKIDATEIFGPLPNGLFWWALANGQGLLQNAAPTNVAADRRTYTPAAQLIDSSKERPSYRILEIQNAHSCMGCHAEGLRSAPDYVSSTVAAGKLKVLDYDKKTVGKIEDFFDARAQTDAMTTDSLGYTKAIQRITGKAAKEAGAIFAAVRWRYAEAPVPMDQAARELNVLPEAFDKAARAGDGVRLAIAYWLLGKGDQRNAQAVLGLDDAGFKAFLSGQPVPLGSNTLRALVTGTSIPRDIWQQAAYREAALLICYGTGERGAVTRQMVRERAKPPEKPVDERPVKIKYDPPTQPERKRDVDRATGRPIEFNPTTGVWEFSR